MPKASLPKVHKPSRRRRLTDEQLRGGLLAITGGDPDKRYKWAHAGNSMGNGVHSVGRAEAIGWDVEYYRQDGPRPVIGKTGQEGEEVRVGDLVLMSIGKEDHDDIEERGADGQSGQRWADEIQEKMFKRTSRDVDTFRGLTRIGPFQVRPSAE